MNTSTGLKAAAAAAVIGLGLPLAASAQEAQGDTTTSEAPAMTDAAVSSGDVSSAMANSANTTDALAQMASVDPAHVRLVAVTSSAMQSSNEDDPYATEDLQTALADIPLAGGDNAMNLGDYLANQGVDVTRVVAANVGNDGSITVYYQQPSQ